MTLYELTVTLFSISNLLLHQVCGSKAEEDNVIICGFLLEAEAPFVALLSNSEVPKHVVTVAIQSPRIRNLFKVKGQACAECE